MPHSDMGKNMNKARVGEPARGSSPFIFFSRPCLKTEISVFKYEGAGLIALNRDCQAFIRQNRHKNAAVQ